MLNNKYGFKLGCNVTQWVGDGYCDDVSNTIECNYDGGDCCLDNTNTVSFFYIYCLGRLAGAFLFST